MDHVVVPMLAAFQRTRPGVRITIQPAYVAEALALIRQARVDLALCPVELVSDDESTVYTAVLPARNVVAARAGHPLLRRQDLKLPDILSYPWISPPEGSPLWQDMQTTLLNLGAQGVPIALQSATSASVLNYLLLSDALALLPETVVRAMARSGVSQLPLQLPAPARQIGILSRRSDTQSRLVRLALKSLLEGFARLAP